MLRRRSLDADILQRHESARLFVWPKRFQAAQKAARSYGFELEEIVLARRKDGRSHVAAKYRHPENDAL